MPCARVRAVSGGRLVALLVAGLAGLTVWGGPGAPLAAQQPGRTPPSLDRLEGGDKLRALMEAVVETQRSVRTLRADFTMRKRSELLLEPVESSGLFTFRAPDSVRWDYRTPAAMVVLLAESRLTTFLPDRRRAETVRLSGRHRRFVGVLAGTQPLDELAENFRITLTDPGGSVPYRLTLLPTQTVIRRTLRSLVLEVDRTLLLPVTVEYEEADGDSTRYEFHRLEVNPDLGPGQFVLDLDADVVVDEVDASSGLG